MEPSNELQTIVDRAIKIFEKIQHMKKIISKLLTIFNGDKVMNNRSNGFISNFYRI